MGLGRVGGLVVGRLAVGRVGGLGVWRVVRWAFGWVSGLAGGRGGRRWVGGWVGFWMGGWVIDATTKNATISIQSWPPGRSAETLKPQVV